MNLKRISVKLSWMLRHCQSPLYIDLNGGWADVNAIVRALKKQFPDFDRETLELIVAQDEKGRYSFDETGAKIRANQGHSIVISRNYALLNFSLPCLQRGHFQSSGKSSKATPSCSAGSYT